MSTKIKISTPLRRHTNGLATIEIRDSENVRDALDRLSAQYPTLSERLFDREGQVKAQLNVFVNNQDIRLLNGLETHVRDGDTMVLLPALTGG